MKGKIGKVIFVAICCAAQYLQAAEETPAISPGIRSELLKQVEEVEAKIMALADAFPEDKYSWRPADGIRSVSEVFVHIAGANFLIPRFAGIEPPPGLTPDMEKTITQKPKVLQLLKQSFEHVRQAIQKTEDSDLERKVKFFNGETTIRNVFLTAIMHMHEHLGQLIAYARMNGVVPPWSASGSRE